MPFITDILIASSNFIVNYGVFLLIGIIGLVVLFKHLLKEPSRELRWHKFLLKWPLIGELIRTSEAARYSSTLGLLVKSGVPCWKGCVLPARCWVIATYKKLASLLLYPYKKV